MAKVFHGLAINITPGDCSMLERGASLTELHASGTRPGISFGAGFASSAVNLLSVIGGRFQVPMVAM